MLLTAFNNNYFFNEPISKYSHMCYWDFNLEILGVTIQSVIAFLWVRYLEVNAGSLDMNTFRLISY